MIFYIQPLKRQEKMHLKMSSAELVCRKYLPNSTDELSIEASSVDPEQTAPIGAVWSGSTLFVIEVLNISADEQSRRLLLRLAH